MLTRATIEKIAASVAAKHGFGGKSDFHRFARAVVAASRLVEARALENAAKKVRHMERWNVVHTPGDELADQSRACRKAAEEGR